MGPSGAETVDTAFNMLKSPSSVAHQEAKQSPAYKPPTPDHAPEDGNPLVVKLEIRRGRLAILTVIAVSAIIVLMAVFSHGVEISTFDASTKTSDQQTKLTDDYNSYSGHITSAFTTPLEVFVSNSVQIVVLHFMVSSVLRGEPTMTEYAITLAFGTGVTYLISNGFEAVNVQLRDLPVVPRMVNNDLFAVDNFTYAEEVMLTSNTASTNPEFQENNPITNTILRNLAAPRYQKESTICNWEQSVKRFVHPMRDEAMDISIPGTNWQGLLLQHAVAPKNLTIVVNATDPNTNAAVKSENLPMDVTTAANLLSHALLMPWGYGLPWGSFFQEDLERMKDGQVYPAAEFLGLLTLPSNASETVKRESFLKDSSKLVAEWFSGMSINTSLSDIGVTFSHVDVSPLVTFDSVTIEVEVKRELLTDVTLDGDKTRYTVLNERENFAPWRGYTMIKKTPYSSDATAYDPPTQINAQRFCLNDAGTEELQIQLDSTLGYQRLKVPCPQASTNSLLLVSVGKRLVADELIQNMTATSSGLAKNESQAVVTNLRKFVSFTVGRLAWTFTDLSKQFHAECFVDRDTNCSGLVFPLGRSFGSNKDDVVAQKQLLLSADMLPLSVLSTTEYMLELPPRVLPLVKVYEPLRPVFDDKLYDIAAGDPLMPHNIKNITWYFANEGPTVSANACSTVTEDRVAKHINNHMYIESPVQPTYTAGLFFLLQMAVVRETVNITDTKQTLNFEYNLHTKSVFVSIPNRNAWFTIGGCIVLAVGLAVVGLQSAANKPSQKKDELAHITDPHTIARVMLDEDQFPPMLLRRRVLNPLEGDNAFKMDSFAIRALSLKHEDDDAHHVTAMV